MKPADRSGGYRFVAVETPVEDPRSEAQIERSFQPSMRVPLVLLTTLITAIASVTGTYFATRNTAPADHAAEYRALDTHLAQLSADVDRLAVTVARNADQAHNDTASVSTELHAYMASHAR